MDIFIRKIRRKIFCDACGPVFSENPRFEADKIKQWNDQDWFEAKFMFQHFCCICTSTEGVQSSHCAALSDKNYIGVTLYWRKLKQNNGIIHSLWQTRWPSVCKFWKTVESDYFRGRKMATAKLAKRHRHKYLRKYYLALLRNVVTSNISTFKRCNGDKLNQTLAKQRWQCVFWTF